MNLPKFKTEPAMESAGQRDENDPTTVFQTGATATEIKYTIKETSGWNDYVIVGPDEVENGGTITNKQLKVELQLLKVEDVNPNKYLEGATFEVYTHYDASNPSTNVPWTVKDEDGVEKPLVITTGPDGKADMGILVEGTYYLVETVAPAGYMIEPNAIQISVFKENDQLKVSCTQGSTKNPVVWEADESDITLFNASVTVTNHSGATLPSTGGMGTTVFGIAGVGIIALAVIMLLKKRMEMVED